MVMAMNRGKRRVVEENLNEDENEKSSKIRRNREEPVYFESRTVSTALLL